MENYHDKLRDLIRANDWFMGLLRAARDCNPPDWLIGGGVIRTLVWDNLHRYSEPTPSRDIDLAFFDPTDLRPERDEEVQRQLYERLPGVPWEAVNQAAVHLWVSAVYGKAVPPLVSSADGIGTWPETATATAVRLLPDDTLEIIAPCGLEDLFGLVFRRNPRQVSPEDFRRRVLEKKIVEKWPMVQIIY